jgi:diguanylate cyclase (GGDEF)-like protein
VYHERLALNSVDKDRFSHTYRIRPVSSEKIAPLVAAIPHMERYEQALRSSIDAFMAQMATGTIDFDTFVKNRMHLAIASKGKDAYFRRLDENFNVLISANLSQLHSVTARLANAQQNFRLFSMLMTAGTLLVVGWLASRMVVRAKRETKRLSQQLFTDSLTQLGSRKALEMKQFGPYSVVYMVDIDNFSDTNSLYGNATGDQLLQAVATRIRRHCHSCSLHRFGGDIFAMMAPDLRETGLSIKKRIRFIEEVLEGKAFQIGEQKIQVGVTIGVGVGADAVAQAMMALDIAKVEKKPYKIYSRRNKHTRTIEENLQWHKRIQEALKHDRVVPFAQPIVDANGRIMHCECLMRIAEETPEGTRYIPPMYLDAAKQLKLYPRLSKSMIEKSFKAFADGGSFSINLSYLDIKEPTMKLFLEELIVTYQAQGRVTFELLEHESLEDFDLVSQFLTSFKALGVKIAIDDFGSNYSNLMEIIRFRPNYLKIDGSVISNIAPGNDAYVAVDSIVQFAHRLGIKTVAEFVADRATFMICRDLGIDLFQGYYFAKPMPAEEAIVLGRNDVILPLPVSDEENRT